MQQIIRDDSRAIYEKYMEGELRGYEVIRIRVAKPSEIKIGDKVHTYPEREIYPYTEEFGAHGWDYGCLDKPQKAKELAFKRYESIGDNSTED